MKNWGLSSAGRAPALQAGGHRFEPCRPQLFSNLFARIMDRNADVAQLAEQLICNQQVIGSSPIIGFILYRYFLDGFPSGQRGQTVNLLSVTSVVRIHPHPFNNSLVGLFLNTERYDRCSRYRGVEQSGSSSGS